LLCSAYSTNKAECTLGSKTGCSSAAALTTSLQYHNHFSTMKLINLFIAFHGVCNDFMYRKHKTKWQLNTGRTSIRNKVFFSARFYCALLTLHVSAPFGGHLQEVRKHKKYPRQSYIFNRSVE
jgi:hypothetical protein